MKTRTRYDIPCNIAQSLNIIGDRWTLLIVHEIFCGRTLFNEIKKALNGISSNLLSERLKYLEQEGLVKTELYSEHPPRYCYQLTESGKELEHVFNAIIIWGSNNLKKCYKKIVDEETGWLNGRKKCSSTLSQSFHFFFVCFANNFLKILK